MTITASALRSDVYRLLDRVLATGEPVYVERKGRRIKIASEETTGRLSRLVQHDCIKGDPEDIVHLDWSGEWHHDLP